MDLLSILINYGLAGIVIWLFYSLIRNELRHLSYKIEKLSYRIEHLKDTLEILITKIDKIFRK